MNTHFKSALNNIQAEERLVEKTKSYVLNELSQKKKGRWVQMKKYAIAACIALFILAGGSAYGYFGVPNAYISVDINPSIELGVSMSGNVVSAEGYNEDGEAVLEQTDVKGKKVKEAVKTIVESAVEQGFVEDDGSTIISITSETKHPNQGEKLTEEAEAGAENAVKEHGKSAVVLKDNVALDRRDEARELGITPGKLNLIQKLQAVDPTATVEEYKDATVKEIITQSNEKKKEQKAEEIKNPNQKDEPEEDTPIKEEKKDQTKPDKTIEPSKQKESNPNQPDKTKEPKQEDKTKPDKTVDPPKQKESNPNQPDKTKEPKQEDTAKPDVVKPTPKPANENKPVKETDPVEPETSIVEKNPDNNEEKTNGQVIAEEKKTSSSEKQGNPSEENKANNQKDKQEKAPSNQGKQ